MNRVYSPDLGETWLESVTGMDPRYSSGYSSSITCLTSSSWVGFMNDQSRHTTKPMAPRSTRTWSLSRISSRSSGVMTLPKESTRSLMPTTMSREISGSALLMRERSLLAVVEPPSAQLRARPR